MFSLFRPTITGFFAFGLEELVSRPNMPVLLDWTLQNADALLKVRRVESRGLSGALLRFSGVPV